MSEEREQSMGSYSEADEALAFTIDPPPSKARGLLAGWRGRHYYHVRKRSVGNHRDSTVFWSRAPSPQLRGRADRGCGEVTSAHPSMATTTSSVSDGSS